MATEDRAEVLLARIEEFQRTAPPEPSLHERLHVPPKTLRRRRVVAAAIVAATCGVGYLVAGGGFCSRRLPLSLLSLSRFS